MYERPASAFVAGFVGTSNVIDGDLAVRLVGRADRFTVRPEKIAIVAADAPHDAADGEVRATGTVRSAVYLGKRARVIVDLDGGGSVVVVEQNRSTTHQDGRTAPGTSVRLAWDRQFDQVLPDPTIEPTDADAKPRTPRSSWRPTPPEPRETCTTSNHNQNPPRGGTMTTHRTSRLIVGMAVTAVLAFTAAGCGSDNDSSSGGGGGGGSSDVGSEPPRSVRGRASSTSSPGRATPRMAPTIRQSTGCRTSRRTPGARPTSRSATPPMRWCA